MAATIVLTLSAQSELHAQERSQGGRPATVVAGNAVIGGLTAAIHATTKGRPVGKALLSGALGGALHGTGKILSVDFAFAGMTIGALGSSVVANAGRGIAPFDELMLPLGPGRIRVTRDPRTRVTATLNAYETALLLGRLTEPGRRVDWSRSLQSGTFVLRAQAIAMAGRRAAGLTSGSTIILSDAALDVARTFKHERIHVQQGWFFQEVFGRPLENTLRERSGALRWIPRWLEIGAMPPGLLEIERHTIGRRGPIGSWREAEAESLEKRDRR